MGAPATFQEKKRITYSEACAFLHGTTRTPVLYDKGPASELAIVQCLTGSKDISERVKSDGRMLVDWQFVLAHVLGIVGLPHMIPEMFRYMMQFYYVQYLGADPSRAAYKDFSKWAKKDLCFALRDIYDNVIESYKECLPEKKRLVFDFLTDAIHTSRRAAHAFYLEASSDVTDDDPETFLVDALENVVGLLEDLVENLIDDADVVEGRDFEPLKELQKISTGFEDDWEPADFSSKRKVYQTSGGCSKSKETFCKAAHYTDTSRRHSGPDFVGPDSAMYVLTAKLASENHIAFPSEIFLSAFQDMRKTDSTDYKSQDDNGKLDWETLQDKFDEVLFGGLPDQHQVARFKRLRSKLSGLVKDIKATLDNKGDLEYFDSKHFSDLKEELEDIYNELSQPPLPKNLQPSFCGEALIPDYNFRREREQRAAKNAGKSTSKPSSGGRQGTVKKVGKSPKKPSRRASPTTRLSRSQRAKRRATIKDIEELTWSRTAATRGGDDSDDDGFAFPVQDVSPEAISPRHKRQRISVGVEQGVENRPVTSVIYYEQQVGRECGMCAINNLLQQRAATKLRMDSIADKLEEKDHSIERDDGTFEQHKDFDGNWSIETLRETIKEVSDDKFCLEFLKETNIYHTQGVILNYSLKAGRHYIALLKLDGKFYALDSRGTDYDTGILSDEDLFLIASMTFKHRVHIFALFDKKTGNLADLSEIWSGEISLPGARKPRRLNDWQRLVPKTSLLQHCNRMLPLIKQIRSFQVGLPSTMGAEEHESSSASDIPPQCRKEPTTRKHTGGRQNSFQGQKPGACFEENHGKFSINRSKNAPEGSFDDYYDDAGMGDESPRDHDSNESSSEEDIVLRGRNSLALSQTSKRPQSLRLAREDPHENYTYMRGCKALVWNESMQRFREDSVVSKTRDMEFSQEFSQLRNGRGEDNQTEYTMSHLVLPPNTVKNGKFVYASAMLFVVAECEQDNLEVSYIYTAKDETKKSQRYMLGKHDMFRVPKGNTYKLKNHFKTHECHLYWIAIDSPSLQE